MKILHILNSDFGSRATMGIRSYHILKSMQDFAVYCRANVSDIHQEIYCSFVGARFVGRSIQFLRMLHPSFASLKKIEKKLFENRAKKLILEADIVHFFYHSKTLLEFAIKHHKKVIMEGFTNPLKLEAMQAEGLLLDIMNFKADAEELYCYQNCDVLISPSAWVTKTFEETVLKGKLVEIPYGVESFQNPNQKLKNSKLKFCFAGGLKRTKGVLDLLEAARELSVDYPNQFEVHLYGRTYGELKKEISEFKENCFFFHGYENELQKIYSDKDVYVFPSYFEGSSKTVLEAMAFGLPVITTFNSGSVAQEGINGFFVEVNSPADLFKAMRKFLENPLLVQEMGEKSQKIAQTLTWDLYAQKVQQVYRDLGN